MKLNNHVIIVSQFLGPMLSDLVKELISSGSKVILISGDKIDVKSTNLIFFNGPKLNRNNIFKRFKSWMKFVLFSFNIIRKLNRQLLILFTTNPPILSWIGLYFKLVRNQKYLVRILDIYPDVLVWAGVISKKNPISKIWVKLNNFSYNRARKVICVGKLMAERINYFFHSGNITKMIVIPDWADTDYLKPIEKKDNPFVKKYSLLHVITVMYSGNIGITHDISILIDLAEKLRYDKRFKFVIIGDEIKSRKLKLESTNRNLDNIIFLPFQDRDQFNYAISAADITVVSMQEGLEGIMMPCKTYSGMAAGSVIFGISQPPNDMEYIINRYKCGFNVMPGDISSALKMLHFFADNPELLIEYKRNSRKNAENHFSRALNTLKIIDIIKKESNSKFL